MHDFIYAMKVTCVYEMDARCKVMCVYEMDARCKVKCVYEMDSRCKVTCVYEMDSRWKVTCVYEMDARCKVTCVYEMDARCRLIWHLFGTDAVSGPDFSGWWFWMRFYSECPKWEQHNSAISMEDKSYHIHSCPKTCCCIHPAASTLRPGACKRLVTDVYFLLPILFYTWH
jgi:hypothetical protein